MRETSVLARFPHTAHDELWRAARYAATDRTIAPERRVAVLCGRIVLAAHHAASDVSGFAMEKAVATLTEPGVLTLRNAQALLFPLRQLATGPLAGTTTADDAALEAVYETAEREIAARCNLDGEAAPDATLEADANELLAAPRRRSQGGGWMRFPACALPSAPSAPGIDASTRCPTSLSGCGHCGSGLQTAACG